MATLKVVYADSEVVEKEAELSDNFIDSFTNQGYALIEALCRELKEKGLME